MSSIDKTGPGAVPDASSHWQEMRRVLVATDDSPSSADAVDFAAGHGAELLFVHVVPIIDFIPPVELEEPDEVVLHEPTDADQAPLRQAASVAARRGVVATTKLANGSPAEESWLRPIPATST